MQLKLKLTVVAAIAAVAGVASAQEQVVKIGHVAPVSGAQAHYGKDNENGARMAIEELNAQGVTIGGKKIKFELVAEDDAADPKQGTAAAQKLCDAKVAGVVGHLNSGTTIPASKVYNDCGIPHVTGAATNPNLTKPGYKTTFRIIANDNALGAGLAFYAADTLKLKTVAIVDDRTAYGQGVADVFKKTAAAKGMKVVDEQFTTDKATDFMAILTAIKSKNPDAIFFGGMDPQAGPMLRQMEQLGMGNVKYSVVMASARPKSPSSLPAPRHWPTWFAPKAALLWTRCLAARLGRPSTTPSTPTSSRCTAPTPMMRPSCWLTL